MAKLLRTGETNQSQSERGDNRPMEVDDEMMVDGDIMLVDDDPTITLKCMNKVVRAAWPVSPVRLPQPSAGLCTAL